MRKFIFIVLISLILPSCHYLLVPRRYYDNYTRIINDKNRDTISFDLNKVYVLEDTFLTKYYKTKSYSYSFLYKNNLIADITTPLVYDNRIYPLSEKTLADFINNGFFNNPNNKDKINWDYYEIKDGILIRYIVEYNPSSGHNVLNQGKIKKVKYHIIKNGFIYNKDLKTKKDSLLEYNYNQPKEFSVKPDSSKSEFIYLYKRYLETGSRRLD